MKKMAIALVLLAAFLYAVLKDGAASIAAMPGSHGSTIEYVPAGDEAYHVVKSLGVIGHAFMYTIDIGEESIANVDYWIDRYTAPGEMKTIMSSTNLTLKQGEQYQLFLGTIDAGQENEIWVLSMRNGANYSTVSTSFSKDKIKQAMSGNIINTSEITKDEQIDLAVIKRSSKGGGMSFTNVVDGADLQEHEELIVLRCRFY